LLSFFGGLAELVFDALFYLELINVKT
jgi:hypothetical protein